MDKFTKHKLMLYNDPSYGDFSFDVLRMSHHATQRAKERKIPVAELLQPRSHINGYIDRVVSKNGVIITAYPRTAFNYPLPENGRRFTFPRDGIGLFIGTQHTNIKRLNPFSPATRREKEKNFLFVCSLFSIYGHYRNLLISPKTWF